MFYVENCIKSTEKLLELKVNKCGRQEHFCIDCDVSNPVYSFVHACSYLQSRCCATPYPLWIIFPNACVFCLSVNLSFSLSLIWSFSLPKVLLWIAYKHRRVLLFPHFKMSSPETIPSPSCKIHSSKNRNKLSQRKDILKES